ncbi:MAG: ribosome biogenesis GTPase Der [Synergistaceae bacterium]|jgi:GTP-binding protein|nr:ribosome biogenesis GTPase Der [Synergistaceae bacterium]
MGIIAIVGRPNVGKSSIFNRLLGRRESIVDDFPGVTRDRLYGEMSWDGRGFYIVDTGGIIGDTEGSTPEIEARMELQVKHALAESDGAVLVLDGREGLTAVDWEIAEMLRRGGKPVVVAVNKLDNPAKLEAAYDASELGFDLVLPISAEHNFNMGELLDGMVSMLRDDAEFERADEIPVAIVGRPNVGKSSLLNVLAGEERALVSETPGTTRDVVDSIVEIDGTVFRFLDTAGLRRKSRVNTSVEYFSNVRTYQAIDRCRVAVVILDSGEFVTEQDKRLIGQVMERGKGLLILVNKWDLASKDAKVGDRTRAKLRDELSFVSHAPILFISTLTKRGVSKLDQHIKEVDENRRRRISTSELNRLVKEVLIFERMPGDGRGRYLKVSFCTQANGIPPAFVFFVNNAGLVTKPFERRMENILRRMSDFSGVPVRLFFKNKREKRA